MASASFPTRLKAFRKAALAQGWEVGATKAGHPVFMPPAGLRFVVDSNGTPVLGKVIRDDEQADEALAPGERRGGLVPPVTFAKTPSDQAGDRNARSALRRAGVAV